MRIPDDVFETRCRFCHHGHPENNNQEIPDERIFSAYWTRRSSCQILGISKPNKVQGECLSFTPNHIFGICLTCESNNSFHEGYCRRQERPNYRQVYLGNCYDKGGYWQHTRCTCDAYAPNPYWIDIMQREAADGRIPRNFDPETMKPIGPTVKNETAERWADIDRKRAAEEERKEAKKQAEKLQEAEQLTLFSLAE